ncbi:MAG: phosphatase PAP2 family protein [Beijerinckiaceae bacterium]|nr:phosphatase PAP2 family protein [Beijerinckiaceae bacterium]
MQDQARRLDEAYDAFVASPAEPTCEIRRIELAGGAADRLRAVFGSGTVRAVAYDAELAMAHLAARDTLEQPRTGSPDASDGDLADDYRRALGRGADIPGHDLFHLSSAFTDGRVDAEEMLVLRRQSAASRDGRPVAEQLASGFAGHESDAALMRSCQFNNPNAAVPLSRVAGTLESALDSPAAEPWKAKGYYAGYSNYLAPEEIGVAEIVSPPPEPGSDAYRRDLDAVRNANRERSAEQMEAARLDAEMSVFRFADVLGPGFAPEAVPFSAGFLRQAFLDSDNAIAAVKASVGRARPFMVDPEIVTIVEQPPNASFPSGHSAFGHLNARLLARAVPEQADALLARGDAYAARRVIAGVHFPSDLEGGREAAIQAERMLMDDPRFRRDFERARSELRQALGLEEAAMPPAKQQRMPSAHRDQGRAD